MFLDDEKIETPLIFLKGDKMYKIVFLGLFLGMLFMPFANAQEKAELTKYSGNVEVLIQGADSYIQAEEGMELQVGDKIKTGSGAYAELSFNDDNTNVLRVEENTAASVIFSGDEKVEMEQAEVFSTINTLPSGSVFEIRTHTAVSGARGTDWVTKVTDEGTDVEAIDSTPYVKHFEAQGVLSKEPTFISAGQITSVKKFQKPAMLMRVPEHRRQKFHAMKQDVNKHAKEAIMKRKERPAFDRKDFLDKQKNIKQGKDLSQFKDKTEPRDKFDEFKPLISKEGEYTRKENKPSLGEGKPSHGENKPSFSENKPSLGENKPSPSGNKPPLSGRRISPGNKPSFGGGMKGGRR